MYPVTADPPFDPGATNATLNAPGPLTDATTLDGAPGTPTATTELDALDAVDEPAAFAAVTEHVYDFAADNAVTTIGLEAPVTLRVVPPSLDTHDTEYDAVAPFSAPGVNPTLNAFAPDTLAIPVVGASGTFAATTLADALDALEVPTAFVAVIEQA